MRGGGGPAWGSRRTGRRRLRVRACVCVYSLWCAGVCARVRERGLGVRARACVYGLCMCECGLCTDTGVRMGAGVCKEGEPCLTRR